MWHDNSIQSKDLEFELKHGTLKSRCCKRLNSHEDEIKLRLAAKEEINEIVRSKEEVENNQNILLNIETETSKLLIDLEYEKGDILCDIIAAESKLKRLGVSPI